MKQVVFDKENPGGRIVEVEATVEHAAICADPIKEFFEGLASNDTNSIAKIRQLARAFLNEGEKYGG